MSPDQLDSSDLDDSDSLGRVRAVADAVLYEGYLLYPYRASSSKNQCRWQFGVLGPPGASAAGLGEEPGMAMQCLLRPVPGTSTGTLTVHLRFLQLQVREAQRVEADGGFVRVDELTVDGRSVLTWDEAVECEAILPAVSLPDPTSPPDQVDAASPPDQVDAASPPDPVDAVLEFPGGEELELLTDAHGVLVGRIVRRRWPLVARVRMHGTVDDGFVRMSVSVDNEQPGVAADKDDAIRTSLIGAHLLLHAEGADFVSLLEPPDEAVRAAARCQQRRCWPVLAGAPGSTDVVLGAPIILYDHPEVAEQSPGALFDSTEIDEILTLRVMTMTEEEKAEARATDPKARAIIDRCDNMTVEDLQQLHGILRDPNAVATMDPAAAVDAALMEAASAIESVTAMDPGPAAAYADLRDAEPPSFQTGDAPWWDPQSDESVQPGVDAVMIDGVSVARGSLVRVHPSRRADAQDLFYADQVARVTAVLSDVDGGVHVALVLVDDPATEMHEWYGRYFYFAPDELEPLPVGVAPEHAGAEHAGTEGATPDRVTPDGVIPERSTPESAIPEGSTPQHREESRS